MILVQLQQHGLALIVVREKYGAEITINADAQIIFRVIQFIGPLGLTKFLKTLIVTAYVKRDIINVVKKSLQALLMVNLIHISKRNVVNQHGPVMKERVVLRVKLDAEKYAAIPNKFAAQILNVVMKLVAVNVVNKMRGALKENVARQIEFTRTIFLVKTVVQYH
jgi:hypothetical protein